jgi:hypothetical protein
VRAPRRRAFLALAAAVLGLALPGGAAVAFWSGSGSGSGAAAGATAQSLTIAAGAATAGLHPGGQSAVALVLSNPNAFPVQVPSLVLDATQGTGGFAVDAAHSGCALGSLSFATQTNGGAGWSVPARVGVTNGQLTLSLTGAVAMTTAAADACQGAAFTVFVRVGP